MKTATFLFFFLIPSTFFAQRGYCPCMERKQKNNGIDLSQILNQINDQAISLNRETLAVPVVQMPQVIPVSAPPPKPGPVLVEQEVVDPLPEVEEKEAESHTAVRAEKNERRSRVMKRKKRQRIRLRFARKTKKYRGNCPVFN